MSRLWRTSILLCVTTIVAPAVARAQHNAADVAEAGLADARHRYAELDYQGALDALGRVLALPGLGDAEKLEAYEYLGACDVILEREPEARDAFRAMLALDPYHVLREPTGSPKIARLVDALRAELAPDAALDPAVRLTLDLPRALRVHAAGRATVRVVDPSSHVARVTLYVRGAEGEAFEPVTMGRAGQAFTAPLAARETPDELELYAEARDADDRVVARAGEPLTPFALPVRGAEGGAAAHPGGGSIAEQWWFWAIVGGVVAIATGLTVGLLVGTRESAPEGSLPPGKVLLPLVGW